MQDIVKDYYGKQLSHSDDLKTDACCDLSQTPSWLQSLLSNIHPEVRSRYYGCGLVSPELLTGCRILDLGCGSGRDVYLLSQLVGPTGHIVGVDMTDEQLAVAEKHQAWHAEKFGFANVTFLKGEIEKLDQLPLEPASFDIVVSNCVINLSTDKSRVFAGIQKLLKSGGEFYFSDVYANRRLSDQVKKDPIVYGECLGGALYWHDFIHLAQINGFCNPRLHDQRPLAVQDAKIRAKVGTTEFSSATFRLYNIDTLEPFAEDYGQAVVYQGTIKHYPHQFQLDNQYTFSRGKVTPVCGNTWRIIQASRLAPHFQLIGSFEQHFGTFEPMRSEHSQQILAEPVNEEPQKSSKCCG